MSSPVVGGLLAFAGGCAVSVLNYFINRRTLEKKPSALASVSVARQFLSIGYLVLVFFLAKVLPWDHAPLLLGAAVGLTIPSILLAMRLAKLNDSMKKTRSDTTGKGDDSRG